MKRLYSGFGAAIKTKQRRHYSRKKPMMKSKRFFDKYVISSVFNQNDESQNWGKKKAKHAKFSEKQTFLTPWYTHVHVSTWGKKCSFFGKFGMIWFAWCEKFKWRTRATWKIKIRIIWLTIWEVNVGMKLFLPFNFFTSRQLPIYLYKT